MKIIISGRKKVSRGLIVKLEEVLMHTIKTLKQPEKIEVELSFVGPITMQKLNRETRNIDKITDVLSFPAYFLKPGEKIDYLKLKQMGEIDFESGEVLIGDVIICTERSKQQAREFGHSEDDEIVRLFTHSILHLFGYDHIKDEDYNIMHPLELNILKKCGYDFKI